MTAPTPQPNLNRGKTLFILAFIPAFILSLVPIYFAAAAGLPRPPVYILPKVRTINGAAIGWDGRSAVVVISAGALAHLSAEELKALTLHGLARVLSGDAALALTLSGWRQALLPLTKTADGILDTSGHAARNAAYYGTGDSGAPLAAMLGLLLHALNFAGYLSALILEKIFFRRRYFKADAETARLLGEKASLAGVLKKIGGTPKSVTTRFGSYHIINSFFFASPDPGRDGGFLGPNPSVRARLKALNPADDGSVIPDGPDIRPQPA